MYQAHTGDVADAPYRNQQTNLAAGNYLIDGGGVSIADSTTSVKTTVEESVLWFRNEPVNSEQQTLTHPDGDPDDPRIDAITIDANGTAARTVGTPAPADPPNRIGQRVRTPTPPDLSDTTAVCVAFVWIPAGVGSSSEMFNDWVIPREMPGHGLNQLELLPGRDLQYRLDQAREGETLRGDKSQQITLAQPLTISTPGVTIEGLNLKYANGTATSNTDDMITVDAPNVTVHDLVLDGNKQNQPADPDGVTLTGNADTASVQNIDAEDIAGYAVNLNGGSGVLTDPSVEDVDSTTPGKSALVVQGSVFRATAEKIRARNPKSGAGAVLVRNGPVGTSLDTVFVTQGSYGVKIEDFGAANGDSAPVENTRVNGLTVDETPQALATDVDPIGHRELRLSDVRGRDWTTTTEAAIDLRNINTTTVTNSSLIGYRGDQAIRSGGANTLTVSQTTIRASETDGVPILVRSATNVKIVNNTITGDGQVSNGIYVLARDKFADRLKILNNDIYDIGSGRAIWLREDGADINSAHVKNNVADPVVIDIADTTDIIVKDNLQQ